MQVLHSEYIVPFHHLPPLSQEPREFLSYVSGFAKAQSLQKEVDKMLQKCTLELVDHPGSGYYSKLFLVQKALGEWRPMIDLSSLNSGQLVSSSSRSQDSRSLIFGGEGASQRCSRDEGSSAYL